MLKQEKERIVTELVERLRTSDTLIVADYRGLNMTEIDAVRGELLQHGARFSVVKNTLTRRAADAAGVEALNETARRTRVLALKGGVLQGRAMTADEVRELAALPPLDILRGQVLGAVVAPLHAIAGLVSAPLQDLYGLLDARIEQVGGQGEPETVAAKTGDAAKETEQTNQEEE